MPLSKGKVFRGGRMMHACLASVPVGFGPCVASVPVWLRCLCGFGACWLRCLGVACDSCKCDSCKCDSWMGEGEDDRSMMRCL